jgi:hypothetical protein
MVAIHGFPADTEAKDLGITRQEQRRRNVVVRLIETREDVETDRHDVPCQFDTYAAVQVRLNHCRKIHHHKYIGEMDGATKSG